ncbi:MAG TPA: hypothetical protein PKC30_13335 [Saprospiraceae bacterium]|nr:hypothetical protein [Saprospiraceae bacterium]
MRSFLLLGFMVLFGGYIYGQSCCSGKAKDKAGVSCHSESKASSDDNALAAYAHEMASLNPDIHSEKCEKSGLVSYYRIEKQKNGKEKRVDLSYHHERKSFVEVKGKKKACCSSTECSKSSS